MVLKHQTKGPSVVPTTERLVHVWWLVLYVNTPLHWGYDKKTSNCRGYRVASFQIVEVFNSKI